MKLKIRKGEATLSRMVEGAPRIIVGLTWHVYGGSVSFYRGNSILPKLEILARRTEKELLDSEPE